MQQDKVIAYLEGTVRVPDDLWAIVKRYRQLKRTVDTAGLIYSSKIDEEMNILHDALEVLVK